MIILKYISMVYWQSLKLNIMNKSEKGTFNKMVCNMKSFSRKSQVPLNGHLIIVLKFSDSGGPVECECHVAAMGMC